MESENKQQKVILLVEDQVLIAAATAEKLKRFGYLPLLSHTGEDSIQKCNENPDIALILMDIDLGKGMNGPEAAKEILRIRDVPIVFLTSHAEKEYVELVKEITRYGYIIKNSGDFVLESSINMAFELFDAHQTVKVREDKLIRAEQYSGFGSWHYSTKTGNIDWSDKIYEMYGVKKGRNQIDWNATLDYMYSDTSKEIFSTLADAVKSGKDFQFTYRITHPEKGKRWLSCWGHTVCDKSGIVTGVDGIIQDITRRKEAEYSYRQIFNMSLDLVCVADINSATFLQVNPAFTTKLGYSPEELLGRPFLEFIHPGDIEETRNVIEKQLKQNKNILSFINRYRKKDGEYIYFNWNSHPIAEEGVTYVIAHDITDFVYAQRRSKHLKRLLESIRKINQTIFKIADKQKLIEEVCRELTDTTGYYHTWIALFDSNRKVMNIANFSIDSKYIEFEETLKTGVLPQCIDNILHEDTIKIIEDPASECINCICSNKDPAGYAKMCGKISYNGIIYGATVVTLPVEYAHDQEEQDLFQAIIQDISLAMNRFSINETSSSDKLKMKKHLNDYKRLFDTMLDGYAIHELIYNERGDPVDYRFIDVNPAFEKILDIPGKEIIGKTVLEALPQTEKYWIDTYANVVKTGKPFTFTNYTRSFDKYFKVTAFSPGPDQFVTIFMDVTDQVKSNEELTRQKDLLERIMETSPTGISHIDMDGKISFANKTAERILGLSRENITERGYSDPEWKITAVDGGEFPLENLPFNMVMNSGEAVYDIRHGIELPDGTSVILSINAAPLKNRKGEIVSVVTAMADITKYIASEKEINKLLKEKELLIREVHHRVKNDFTIIKSLMQLQKDQSKSEENKSALDEASSRIAVMTSVYDILYRSDNIHEVSLQHMTAMLIENLQGTIIPPEIKINLQLSDISVDAKTSVNTGIIINELITNAVKYAFRNMNSSNQPKIDICGKKVGKNKISMTVRDNGQGILSDIIDKKQFGFGLFLVDSLAKQHNGKMQIANNNGAEITVQLHI